MLSPELEKDLKEEYKVDPLAENHRVHKVEYPTGGAGVGSDSFLTTRKDVRRKPKGKWFENGKPLRGNDAR